MNKPLIAHVLYRLDTGGMETVLVTVINRTAALYRHAVVCLDNFTDFRERIVDPDVQCLALHKRAGKDVRCYFRLWRALRRLRPALLITYNIGALDAVAVAKLAGVRCVVHAERGRDASDPLGENRRYRRLRRWLAPWINRFVTVSENLRRWLVEQVGIQASKVDCIPNGIDVTRFAMANGTTSRHLLGTFAPPGTLLIGTVGRLDAVKDQAGLVAAFSMLGEADAAMRARLRLVIIGEGAERPNLQAQIAQLGLEGQVCLLGNREDVPALLQELDIFVLSSIAEGMPGAVLEAMAAALPIVATDVGGVAEVVETGVTGTLVKPGDVPVLASALATYCADPALRHRHGSAGRARVESRFSQDAMIESYVSLYDKLLGCHRRQVRTSVPPAITKREVH